MNTKSKTYMKGAEFKERQGSFEFFCARAVKFLTTFHNEYRKGWRELFKPSRRTTAQKQLELNFTRNIADWANWTPEKNRELFA